MKENDEASTPPGAARKHSDPPAFRCVAVLYLVFVFALIPAACTAGAGHNKWEAPMLQDTGGRAGPRMSPSSRAVFRLFAVSAQNSRAAPDFRLRNQDDRLVSLSDFRGHYVHLDFSATWCRPCHFQAKYLRSLERELEPYGFVSMTVMITRNPADVKRWARRYQLRNVLGDLEGEARGRFAAVQYPTNVIVRPDGSIAGRWAGAPRDASSFQRQLRRMVPEMFRERFPDNNNGSPEGSGTI